MAVILVEGFDHLSAAQTIIKGWSLAMSTVGAGRLAGQYAGPGTVLNTKALPGSYSTVYLGAAFWTSALTAGVDFLILMNSTTTRVCRLRFVLSGGNTVLTLLNSAGTTLGTGTTPLATSTWYYVELKLVVHASAGTVELRLNGVSTPEITASGLNTGSLSVDTLGIASVAANAIRLDDMYMLDTSGSSPTNDFLGDCRVETLMPNGNGANTAWTGVYTDWDDPAAHDIDATYVTSATPGDRETSTLADLALATGSVYAVQTNLVARKDDAGARTIAPVLRVGSTNYDGTTSGGLTTTYLDYTQLYDRLDPAGTGWTISSVNALEAGVKEVA